MNSCVLLFFIILKSAFKDCQKSSTTLPGKDVFSLRTTRSDSVSFNADIQGRPRSGDRQSMMINDYCNYWRKTLFEQQREIVDELSCSHTTANTRPRLGQEIKRLDTIRPEWIIVNDKSKSAHGSFLSISRLPGLTPWWVEMRNRCCMLGYDVMHW